MNWPPIFSRKTTPVRYKDLIYFPYQSAINLLHAKKAYSISLKTRVWLFFCYFMSLNFLNLINVTDVPIINTAAATNIPNPTNANQKLTIPGMNGQWLHYAVMSNELADVKLIRCPSDPDVNTSGMDSFIDFYSKPADASNKYYLSYFVSDLLVLKFVIRYRFARRRHEGE